MQLHLLNYIVGLNSFWNFTAPAIALSVFLISFLLFGISKRTGGKRFTLTITLLGLAFFIVAGAVDGSRNVQDVHGFQNAAATRYGLNLSYAQSVDLLTSSSTTKTTVAGAAATVYGATDITVKQNTETINLARLADGTYVLTTNGKELSLKQ